MVVPGMTGETMEKVITGGRTVLRRVPRKECKGYLITVQLQRHNDKLQRLSQQKHKQTRAGLTPGLGLGFALAGKLAGPWLGCRGGADITGEAPYFRV